ncbi:hypothetical protein [Galbibacter mesophilus]|uniref:hypothetical protein n=1 Tax=Galbibacter mesophilus TaxID=379069 RepID=UPI00191F84CF|nr:hypothetical protein [Galbibacter mesophilus]MCM5662364.1 hypothetical protein [Galbibacter mesophilus]
MNSERNMPLNIIEKYDKQFEYVGIAMYVFIASQFFQLWLFPEETQAEKIYSMSFLIIFEFVMVHSGVFMAVMPKKWSFFIFIPFYGVFAWAFNHAVPNNVVLITYLVVVLNRMRFAFFNADKRLKERAAAFSVFALIVYFVLTFVVLFSAEILPEFGLTAEFLEKSGYNAIKSATGTFVDVPQTALCLGVLYYSALAIIEAKLVSHSEKKK